MNHYGQMQYTVKTFCRVEDDPTFRCKMILIVLLRYVSGEVLENLLLRGLFVRSASNFNILSLSVLQYGMLY